MPWCPVFLRVSPVSCAVAVIFLAPCVNAYDSVAWKSRAREQRERVGRSATSVEPRSRVCYYADGLLRSLRVVREYRRDIYGELLTVPCSVAPAYIYVSSRRRYPYRELSLFAIAFLVFLCRDCCRLPPPKPLLPPRVDALFCLLLSARTREVVAIPKR